MLEFQSQPDPYMAARWLHYLGHFYMSQIRQLKGKKIPEGAAMIPPEKGTATGEKPPRYPMLPAVIMLTIYSGEPDWWPSKELRGIIAPGPPGVDQQNLRYHVLDESRVPADRLRQLGGNLTAALIRLERSDTPQELGKEVGSLNDWLTPESDLCRAFGAYLRVKLRREGFEGMEIPDEITNFGDFGNMLAENMLSWAEKKVREGVREGKKKGRTAGEAAMLLRLAEGRFGPLDNGTRSRIETANEETLLRCADRILTARRLPDIFGDK
jgi:hypothetical protein